MTDKNVSDYLETISEGSKIQALIDTVDGYTNDELSAKLKIVPMVRAWCNQVEKLANIAAKENGEKLPDFKLVLGSSGTRFWIDEAEAEKALKRSKVKLVDLYNSKLIGPAGVDDLLKQGILSERQHEKIAALWDKKDPGVLLVPESDKRDEYIPPAADADLPDLDNGEMDLSDLIG